MKKQTSLARTTLSQAFAALGTIKSDGRFCVTRSKLTDRPTSWAVVVDRIDEKLMEEIAWVLCSQDIYIQYRYGCNFFSICENHTPTPATVTPTLKRFPATLGEAVSIIHDRDDRSEFAVFRDGNALTVVCRAADCHDLLAELAYDLSYSGLHVSCFEGSNFLSVTSVYSDCKEVQEQQSVAI